jgi:hypothetical protein
MAEYFAGGPEKSVALDEAFRAAFAAEDVTCCTRPR